MPITLEDVLESMINVNTGKLVEFAQDAHTDGLLMRKGNVPPNHQGNET